MPIIETWFRDPVLDANAGYELWIRSTPTYHGIVIAPPAKPKSGIKPGPDGQVPDESYIGDGRYSSRRYSIARIYPGNKFELIVGSPYYLHDGWDTEDINEPLKKFLTNQFAILYRVPTIKTVEMQSLDEWNGSSQQLNQLFNYQSHTPDPADKIPYQP